MASRGGGEYSIDPSKVKVSAKCLGRGGFGEVFVGSYAGEDVAVKVLHSEMAGVEEEWSKEVEVMAALRHPRILRMFGACFVPKQRMIISELMPKGDLSSLLRSSSARDLPWSIKLQIAFDIAAGLSYLHGKHILHRDLKSLNILLDDRLRAKVSDFGLTKIKTCSMASTTIHKGGAVGTVLWMAPELFGRKVKYSEASDVYAFGMICLELMTHKYPFEDDLEGRDVNAVVPQWVTQGERPDVPDGADIPSFFKKIMQDCWSANVGDRPTMSVIEKELEGKHHTEEVKRQRQAVKREQRHESAQQAGASEALSAILLQAVDQRAGNKSKGNAGVETQFMQSLQVSEKVGDKKEGQFRLVTDSRRQALQACWDKAHKGDADAQVELAGYYEQGQGVEQSYEIAMEWYRKAGEQGHANALFSIGNFYSCGHGVAKSSDEARRWYTLSAKQGHYVAQNNLGVIYYDGNGVPQSYKEAAKWFRLAADQNLAAAQANLGDCYLAGNGVRKSVKEAIKLFTKAAEQGYAGAQQRIGDRYMYGEGVKKSGSAAVEWYKKAADQGHLQGLVNLGKSYIHEMGGDDKSVPLSYEEAAAWFHVAAAKGNTEAQMYLHSFYLEGTGVKKSLEDAVRWCREAADQGSREGKQGLV